jgi:hypothetical protein
MTANIQQFSDSIKLFLENVLSNLKFRIILIKLTGKQGTADDVREKMTQLHIAFSEQLKDAIDNWHQLELSMQLAHYEQAKNYLLDRQKSEKSALVLLNDLQKIAATPLAARLEKALIAHKQLLQLTCGLISMHALLDLHTPQSILKMPAAAVESTKIIQTLNQEHKKLVAKL